MIGDSFFFSLDLFIFFTPPFPLFSCHLPVGDGPHTGSMAPSSLYTRRRAKVDKTDTGL